MIHRRYQYDPAGELVHTLDKLRGEIKYEYEANGQLRGHNTGSLIGSEEFRYDPAANRLNLNARTLEKAKDNRLKQFQNNEYRYDPWGNLISRWLHSVWKKPWAITCTSPIRTASSPKSVPPAHLNSVTKTA